MISLLRSWWRRFEQGKLCFCFLEFGLEEPYPSGQLKILLVQFLDELAFPALSSIFRHAS